MPVRITEGTQTSIATDTVGTLNYQVINLLQGTVSTVGTLPNLPGGSIAVTSLPNITQGSIQVTSGTVNAATAVITSGTINASTTVVSTLPNLPQGSIQVTAGTVTGGTLQNLVSGTINAATAVINSATISVLPNIPGGSIAVTAGTITGGTLSANILPLSGVFLSGTIAVGTTATALPASALSSRKSLILYNNGTLPIYLGGTGVTTATGLPMVAGDYSPSFEVGTTILYGIAAAASGGTVTVLEAS